MLIRLLYILRALFSLINSHLSIRVGPLAVGVAVVRAEVEVDKARLQAPTPLPLVAGHRALKAHIQRRSQWGLFDATITTNAIGTPRTLQHIIFYGGRSTSLWMSKNQYSY